MFADVALPERLLQANDAQAFLDVAAALHPAWHEESLELLAQPRWRPQLVACAAIAMQGLSQAQAQALWQALDGGSWVAPQITATLFLLDDDFEARLEERLLAPVRRSEKVIGAMVRAYHRLPQPRMNVIARLGRHDAALRTQDGQTAVLAVDDWLTRLPLHCDATARARWLRQPRAL